MQENNFDFEHYKNLDFSDARPARLNPKIKAFQEHKKEHDTMVLEQLDDDVQEMIKQHRTPQDRQRLNTMIRVLFGAAIT